jgi:hypothetical protein
MLVHRTSNPPPQIGSQESPDGRKKKVRINREKAAWRAAKRRENQVWGRSSIKIPRDKQDRRPQRKAGCCSEGVI